MRICFARRIGKGAGAGSVAHWEVQLCSGWNGGAGTGIISPLLRPKITAIGEEAKARHCWRSGLNHTAVKHGRDGLQLAGPADVDRVALLSRGLSRCDVGDSARRARDGGGRHWDGISSQPAPGCIETDAAAITHVCVMVRLSPACAAHGAAEGKAIVAQPCGAS